MTASGATLVVGSRGLLGAAVTARLDRAGAVRRVARVDWAGDPTVGLAAALESLVATGGGDLRIAWCAGAGVTASEPQALERELATFRDFVLRLKAWPAQRRRQTTVFFASSAGGVYAGSPDEPPYTETSRTCPLAPYGHAKLAAEQIVADLAESGTRVIVGRIANLYGPGQNLAKSQGLISQLCRGQVMAQPVGIYVSLDTLRDYIYVDDCAAMVLELLDLGARLPPEDPAVIKIMATCRSVSIAGLVGELSRVSRRRPPVVVAASPDAVRQARDLRFRSTVWTHLQACARTPLAVGIAATREEIGRRFRLGEDITGR